MQTIEKSLKLKKEKTCDAGNAFVQEEDIRSLYNQHLRELIAYIYSYFRNEQDTEDTIQDLFYLLHNQVKKQKVLNQNPRAFLFKVARNLCLNHLGQEKKENQKWMKKGEITEKSTNFTKQVDSRLLIHELLSCSS